MSLYIFPNPYNVLYQEWSSVYLLRFIYEPMDVILSWKTCIFSHLLYDLIIPSYIYRERICILISCLFHPPAKC